MDAQTLINIAIGLLGTLGGWVLNSLKGSIQALQEANSALNDKTHEIEVLVVGKYVEKTDLEKLSTALFTKLDRIEIKIDNKMDK